MIDYTLPLDQLPDPLPIEPLPGPFDVSITPPGSKSITCRAYVLAALAKGTSRIVRPLRADDTDTLLKALCTLGAKAEWVRATDRPGDDYPDDVLITGVNGRFPRGGELFMGEGGAPTRFMIACACLAAEPVTIDASPRMRERPIAEGVEMLRALGAKIEYVEEEGRLPVRIAPSAEFKGGTLTVGKTASSQFISAVMLIGAFLQEPLTMHFTDSMTSEGYVALTTETLRKCGFTTVSNRDAQSYWIRIVPNCDRQRRGFDCVIEPDASAAVYFVEACAIAPGSMLALPELSWQSDQPDRGAILGLCRAANLLPRVNLQAFDSGGIRVQSLHREPQLAELLARASSYPDGAVAIATTASIATGTSFITGLSTLRHKETDRLAALETELRKVGCEVETGEGWIKITPMPRDAAGYLPAGPIVIETYNDHRMAMAFAVLGLARPGISIRNPACVRKSYPTFWKDFAKLYQSRVQ